MTGSNTDRKLAAILFADIEGYTALMQSDESSTMQVLRRYQSVLKEEVARYNGKIIKNYGDGSICLFSSVLDAVHCAKSIQEAFKTKPVIPLRIGLHLGDVMYEENDVYGNDLNIASRIESMGIAGAVLMSKNVWDKVKNQSDLEFAALGRFEFKNVEEPIELFALSNEGFVVPKKDQMKGKLKAPAKRPLARLIPLVLAVLLVIAGGFYVLRQNGESVPTTTNSIAIFPFDIKSANPDIQYLSDGLVDLISTKLEGVPNLIPIDPNQVFNQLTKEKETIPALEKAGKMSNALGAAEFILGSIIELNDELQISASRYDSEGALIAKETIDGQKTDLLALIDDLTRALIADKLQEEDQEYGSIATMTSDDLSALKAYLRGEQAYRKADWRKAGDFFRTAVDLDSTFALAWLRLYDSDSWIRVVPNEAYLDKALQYRDKLPPKWQDLLQAKKVFDTGLASNERFFADLIRKYGETAAFVNLMAEHLFHYNHVFGRPVSEARPWLKKVRVLDPENQEALRHLFDIAFIEGDEQALQQILRELPPESALRAGNQARLFGLQDSVSAQEVKALVRYPGFNPGQCYPAQVVTKDPLPLLQLGIRTLPYFEDHPAGLYMPIGLAALQGQEKAALASGEIFQKTMIASGRDPYDFLVANASLISSRNFLPFQARYQEDLDRLRPYEEPRAFFAAAKYAWALNQEAIYRENQQKLAALSRKSEGAINPARYYHWSLAAFEARQNQDNEKALAYIDSAFQYTPGGYAEANAAAVDKALMLADIYEEQQEYALAIQRLENIPYWNGYPTYAGYTNYRLTQLYEKNGQVEKALAKCELFLRYYEDCDEQYRPWWNEVAARQQRLMNEIN